MLTSVNDFSENHLIFTLNELQNTPTKPNTSNTSRQLRHYKNKSNALLKPRDEESREEKRPWTSQTSDYKK